MTAVPTVLAAVLSFGITAALGRWMIPFLHKLKYGQTILDIGPAWHKKKQGTPTMGGFMFIIGITVAVIVAFFTMAGSSPSQFSAEQWINNVRFFAGLVMALAFAFLGFVDDYIKVVKKRNLGLTASQKFSLQIVIAVCYLVTVYLAGDNGTTLVIPFLGQWDLGLLYYPLMLFVIVGFVNAVNLTDGIDGLASSVTFVVAIGFMVVAGILGYAGMGLLATATAGGCIGFLLWNMNPAKVFMGDTGSLFLGGLVVALAFGVGLPIFLLLMGIIYLIEAFSVILQVISFKTTGKRIFKMSPIHHHFEMSGWSENKIVLVFSSITLIGCAIAVVAVVLM